MDFIGILILFTEDAHYLAEGLIPSWNNILINNQNNLYYSTYNNKQITWWKIFFIFMAVTMKNAVFWDVSLCRSCENWYFRETAS
jgi:hypothetical protein